MIQYIELIRTFMVPEWYPGWLFWKNQYVDSKFSEL